MSRTWKMSPSTTWGSTCPGPRELAGRPTAAVGSGPGPGRPVCRPRGPRPPSRLWPKLQSGIGGRRSLGPLCRPGTAAFGILARMEARGILLDQEFLRRFGQDLERQMQRLEKEIYALAGEDFLIQSPQQLGRILFEKLKLTPQKKTKGKTGSPPTWRCCRAWRRRPPSPPRSWSTAAMGKLKSTYVDALLKLVEPRHRAGAHHLSPVGGGHRASVQPGPQLAEHPGPGGVGRPDPPGLRAGPGPRLP